MAGLVWLFRLRNDVPRNHQAVRFSLALAFVAAVPLVELVCVSLAILIGPVTIIRLIQQSFITALLLIETTKRSLIN